MNEMLKNTVEVSQSSLVVILVATALLVVLTIFCWAILIFPKLRIKFFTFIKNLFSSKSEVKTVYSDKTRNYSETEFLPVPSKAPTPDSTYTFIGWNKFAKDKDGNFVTKPMFLKNIKTCIVNVYDDKNNLLERHNVQYGSGIKLIHKLVIKEPTKEFEYEFAGWDKETKAFFENTEIHPVFKAKPIKYNYKFMFDDGKTIVFEKSAIYGTPILCPADPIKLDKNHLYEFVCWKGYKRNMILTDNCVFIAEFNKVEISNKELIKKRNDALEIVVNDFKQIKEDNKKDKTDKQNTQQFKTISNMQINFNKTNKKIETKNVRQTSNEGEIDNKLLKGVVVEKNKKNKK